MHEFTPQGHEHHAAYVREQAEQQARRRRIARSLAPESSPTLHPMWRAARQRLTALPRTTAARPVRNLSNTSGTEARKGTGSYSHPPVRQEAA